MVEFTDYVNSLYPNIKFELIYSDSHLNVLDLTLHFRDGFISTDVYAKPTDSRLYLPFSGSHPSHCIATENCPVQMNTSAFTLIAVEHDAVEFIFTFTFLL